MLFAMVFLGALIIPVHAAGFTTVKVNPLSQTISSGSSFTINIACVPYQPIKGFELKIVFNPSILKANSVSEGNIFNGHSTYFNAGSIDNIGGTIKNIYDVILGSDSVSSSGTLIKISFTAKSTAGTSSINLNNVGIVDNVGYVPITITNGSVQVTLQSNKPPVYASISPTNKSSNIPITSTSLSLTIRDPEGKSFDYSIQTRPNIGSVSVKNVGNGTKSCSISGLKYATTYRWYVNATDGYSWTRQWYTFTTAQNPANSTLILSNANPSKGATNVPISTSTITITVQNTHGHTFNMIFKTNPNIGSYSRTITIDGVKSFSISDLTYDTTYYWYISCKDSSTGQWTNQSYWFTTQDDPSDTGSPGDPGGGGVVPPDDNESIPNSPNNPPDAPIQPIGSIFIGRGINYTYTSSTIDPNGDIVRFQFDWGDGNFSNWTEFIDSNTNISASHAWNALANYSIRIIAQDPNGSNSSWSTPLNITVLEPEAENNTPTIDIKTINSGLVNQTIIFDASVSTSPDTAITSYVWDFGDGTKKTGKTSDHAYTQPGIYRVNLTVTDYTEQTFTKTIQVIIDAYTQITAQPESPSSFPYIGVALLFFTCCIVLSMSLIYRKRIQNTHKSSARHIKDIEEQIDELLFQRYGK
jgi:hypothetical protein